MHQFTKLTLCKLMHFKEQTYYTPYNRKLVTRIADSIMPCNI